MLYVVTSGAYGRILPVDEDSADEARTLFERITWVTLDVRVETATIVDDDSADCTVDAVEAWWGAYCDYAEDNDHIDDAEFNDICARMKRTFDAVYATGKG